MAEIARRKLVLRDRIVRGGGDHRRDEREQQAAKSACNLAPVECYLSVGNLSLLGHNLARRVRGTQNGTNAMRAVFPVCEFRP
jgi:hypothetical protein